MLVTITIFKLAVVTLILTAGLACLAAVFRAVMMYYSNRIYHWLNKRNGKTWFVVSGDPVVTELVQQVCVSTLQRIEAERQAAVAATAEQQQGGEKGIGINDQGQAQDKS